MNNGISIYFGLDNTLEENMQLLELANANNIKRLFTSLHIPETDASALKEELQTVLMKAKQYGMEVISDVSPDTLSLLGMEKFDLKQLERWSISTLRLDFGYTPEQIAALSRAGMRLQFNASTIDRSFLQALECAKVDFSNIDALHNFYPREGTGLSFEVFKRQNELLRGYGIDAAAFVPSYNRTRAPLHKGLPTLELHRYKKAAFAMRHLAASGVQSIFIGDSLPTGEEIAMLGRLTNDIIILKAKCLTQDKAVRKLLSTQIFTVRADLAQGALRLAEGRTVFGCETVMPEYTAPREIGAVTLDNSFAGRYKGELQIITEAQRCDESVNIIARLDDDEIRLLDFADSGSKIKLELIL